MILLGAKSIFSQVLERPTESDMSYISQSLGRPPSVDFQVAVRSESGDPTVILNAPFTSQGNPMPTRWWLVDKYYKEAISRLEANGGVKSAEKAIGLQAIEKLHLEYAYQRDKAIPKDYIGHRPYGGVGGTRQGIKCLHAHFAWFLAGGQDLVGHWSWIELSRVDSNILKTNNKPSSNND